MKRGLCTVVTSNYLPYAFALYESVAKFQPDVFFNVLITDKHPHPISNSNPDRVSYYYVDDLKDEKWAGEIFAKYYHKSMDKFRWSMKAVLLAYLLRKDYDQVAYMDSDIYFFEDPAFLFDELGEHDILLTPQWMSHDPRVDPVDFFRNLYHGHYNGGFVWATKKGLPAIEWWASVCAFKCEKNRNLGLYDDQTYLNLLPVFFDDLKVKIIKHRGCNIAHWNTQECRRTSDSGRTLINNTFPVVFIHFAKDTIRRIRDGADPLLLPQLRTYAAHLQRLDDSIRLLEPTRKKWKFW